MSVCRQDDIAKIIGCAPKTLRKRFRDELDRGVAEANATISGYLFAAAKAGNIAAMIFWLKTRAHWRERSGGRTDAQAPRADAESNSQVVLVLPDNSRDPELTQVLRDAQARLLRQKTAGRSFRNQALIAPGLSRRASRADRRADDSSDRCRACRFPGEGGQTASAPGV